MNAGLLHLKSGKSQLVLFVQNSLHADKYVKQSTLLAFHF